MKRRTYIKLSATLTAGCALTPLASSIPEDKLKNWAGNLEYSTTNISYPKSVEEVQKLLKQNNKVKVLGSRHCFNRIADSKDYLLSTKQMNQVVSLDTNARTVTVEGGINYGELSPYLHQNGFALHNLASLPHISVVGACTTATHGSGVKNGNLATAVSGLEFIDADGEVHVISRKKEGEEINAAVVSLGALGVITKITLDIQPTYMVRQFVYENMPMSELQDNFEKILSAGYSVSLFTDWQNDYINEVWIKMHEKESIDSLQSEYYGAKAATKNLHPIAELSAENCTEQMGVPGAWHDRLPHFKMGFTPSSGKELQAEYFVPFHNAIEAILAVSRLSKQVGPHLFISEIRSIEADSFWMSPCYEQPSVAIHFTLKQDWLAVKKLLPLIEKELAPFNVKPHWGKLFTISPAVLKQRYPKMENFKNWITQYDPRGKFQNDFLNQNIFNS
jgi:xylitol oxidase